ncbi:MAG: hypothetical protein GF364_12615 [Candidatus Lokiarchaeota archaeon]|nr:hypothetical protein [Candidatus Lokiarchaeota archaeon]
MRNNTKILFGLLVIFTIIYTPRIIATHDSAEAYIYEYEGLTHIDNIGGFERITGEGYINDNQINENQYAEMYCSKSIISLWKYQVDMQRAVSFQTCLHKDIQQAKIKIYLSDLNCGTCTEGMHGISSWYLRLVSYPYDNPIYCYYSTDAYEGNHYIYYSDFTNDMPDSQTNLLYDGDNYIFTYYIDDVSSIDNLQEIGDYNRFRLKFELGYTGKFKSDESSDKAKIHLRIIEIDVYGNTNPEVSGNEDLLINYEDTLNLDFSAFDDLTKEGKLYYKLQGTGASGTYQQGIYLPESEQYGQIHYALSDVPAGIHTYVLSLKDAWNEAEALTNSFSTDVTVLNDKPIVSFTPQNLEYMSSNNLQPFTVNDGYFEQDRTYKLLINCDGNYNGGTLVQSGTWEEDSPENLDFDQLAQTLGTHHCRLDISDGYDGTPGYSDAGVTSYDFDITTVDTTDPIINLMTDLENNKYSSDAPELTIEVIEINSIEDVELKIENSGVNYYYDFMDSGDEGEMGDIYVLNGSNFDWSNQWNAIFAEGSHNAQIIATDVSMNQAVLTNLKITKDSTAPLMTYHPANLLNRYSEAPEICISVDEETNCVFVELEDETYFLEQDQSMSHLYNLNTTCVDWAVWTSAWCQLSEGDIMVYYGANDTIDNQALDSFTAYIDRTPPEISLEPLEASYYASVPSLSGIIDENVMGTIAYSFDGISYYELTEVSGTNPAFFGTISIPMWYNLEEGAVSIYLKAVDYSGNVGEIIQLNVVKDTVKPVVDILTPIDSTDCYETSPSYELDIVEEHLDTILVKSDVQSESYTLSSAQGSLPVSLWNALEYGEHMIIFHINDSAGNEQLISTTIEKKSSEIVPEIEHIYDGDYYSTEVPIYSLNVNETLLDQVWYEFANTSIPVLEYNGEINHTIWDRIEDGEITITFFTESIYGNIYETNVTVLKDTTPPIITIMSPLANEEIHDIAPMFIVEVSELQDYTLWYTLDGGKSEYPISELAGNLNQIAWDNAYNATVTITFYATDEFGFLGQQSITIVRSDYMTYQLTGKIDWGMIFHMPGTLIMVVSATVGFSAFGNYVIQKRKREEFNDNIKMWQNVFGVTSYSGIIMLFLNLVNSGALDILAQYTWLGYNTNQIIFIELLAFGLGELLYKVYEGAIKPKGLKSAVVQLTANSMGYSQKQSSRAITDLIQKIKGKFTKRLFRSNTRQVNFIDEFSETEDKYPRPDVIVGNLRKKLAINGIMGAASGSTIQQATELEVVKSTYVSTDNLLSSDDYLKVKKWISVIFLVSMVVIYIVLKLTGHIV